MEIPPGMTDITSMPKMRNNCQNFVADKKYGTGNASVTTGARKTG
jgi:hypothetical protein